MEWTKAKPAKSGYYWYCEPDRHADYTTTYFATVCLPPDDISDSDWDESDGAWVEMQEDIHGELDTFDGYWYGPIEPPEPPSDK